MDGWMDKENGRKNWTSEIKMEWMDQWKNTRKDGMRKTMEWNGL